MYRYNTPVVKSADAQDLKSCPSGCGFKSHREYKKKMKINLVVTKTCFIFDPQMNNTIHIQPVMKNTRRADEGLRLEVAMYNCFMR